MKEQVCSNEEGFPNYGTEGIPREILREAKKTVKAHYPTDPKLKCIITTRLHSFKPTLCHFETVTSQSGEYTVVTFKRVDCGIPTCSRSKSYRSDLIIDGQIKEEKEDSGTENRTET